MHSWIAQTPVCGSGRKGGEGYVEGKKKKKALTHLTNHTQKYLVAFTRNSPLIPKVIIF